MKTSDLKKEKLRKIELSIVEPAKEWKLNIEGNAEKTGCGDCGLFVEAENEKEAIKSFRNLINIIQNKEIEKI